MKVYSIFSGTLEDWREFIDFSDSLEHKNVALADSQKFQFLRSSSKDFMWWI